MANSANMIIVACVAIYGAISARDVAKDVIQANLPPSVEGVAFAPEQVKAGETDLIRWEIVKRTDCPGTNNRVWFGADGFHLTEATKPTTLPTSEELRHYSIPTRWPERAPPGRLEFSIVGEYHCIGSEPQKFRLPTEGPIVVEVVE